MKKEVTDKLVQWDNLQQEMAQLKEALDGAKAQEAILRKEIFADVFPEPREGTNSAPLSGGWVLKGVHTVKRKIDEAALAVVAKKKGMPDVVKTAVTYKPALNTRYYKQLPEDTRKIFDNALVISNGPPKLSIEKPKRSKK